MTRTEFSNPQFSWNQDTHPMIYECVHDLIAHKSRSMPEALAVDSWDGQLSYEQLEMYSNALARSLLDLGVKPEYVVPLLFKKSKWAIVAVVGVLKAGGAFVLLDPTHPLERNRNIIKQVRSQITIVSSSTYEKLGDIAKTVIPLDEAYLGSATVTSESCSKTVTPENMVYMSFTSGSSGTPKGIITEHRNLASNAVATAKALGFRPGLRVAQFATYCFAGAIIDIFCSLVAGCCLCIPSEEDRLNRMKEFLSEMRIQYLHIPPSMRHLNPEDGPYLETVMMGSEPISRDNLETWASHVEFQATYGQSETAVLVCAQRKQENSDVKDLGRPFGSNVWVVHEDDPETLVGLGEVGEVLIEGPSVVRGYDNKEQTLKTFIQPPLWLERFRGATPRHICRSGDLGRVSEHGQLQIVGRKDTQVKLHGHRIEVSEIEYQIRRRLGERDIIVDTVSPTGDLNATLLAAFKLFDVKQGDEKYPTEFGKAPNHIRQEAKDVERKMQTELQPVLPGYMIPSAVVPIFEVPKTATGKLSRRILRDLASKLTIPELRGSIEDETNMSPPVSSQETTLQRLWSEILRIPASKIYRESNFFLLGGDSIKTIALVSAARKEKISVSTIMLWQWPVLSDLSRQLQLGNDASPKEGDSLSDRSLTHQRLFELLPDWLKQKQKDIQGIEVLTGFQTETLLENSDIDHGEFYYIIVDINGPVKLQVLKNACDKLIQQYSILRTIFLHVSDTYIQVAFKPNSLPSQVEFCDLSNQPNKFNMDSFITTDLVDLEPLGSPVAKFFVFYRGLFDYQLVLRVSHAQFDGYCLPFLWRQMKRYYLGQPLMEEEKPFLDFVSDSHAKYRPDDFKYWKDLLLGSSPTELTYPTRSILNEIQDKTLVRVTKGFTSCVNIMGFTAAIFAKIVWAISLARTTGHRDIVFEFLSSGRDVPVDDVDTIVGPCIITLPVRVSMDDKSTIGHILRSLHLQHVRTIAHGIIGSQNIWDFCSPWPKGTRYSTFLQYQSQEEVETFELSDQVSCNWSLWGRYADMQDLQVKMTPNANGTQEIVMTASHRVIPEAILEKTMIALCETIEWINNVSSETSIHQALEGEKLFPIIIS